MGISLLVFFVLFLINITLNKTHAYYGDSVELPLFNARVGDFSGEGESAKEGPLTNKSTDVNIIWYIQMPDNPDKYKENKGVPLLGFTLNETKSNCYPKNNEEGTTYIEDYSISEDGIVDIKVSETKPNQIVCRLYYDRDKISDVIIYAYIQDETGDREYNGSKYKLTSKMPTGKEMVGYKCSKEGTNIDYNETDGFMIDTKGPNTCYIYFN